MYVRLRLRVISPLLIVYRVFRGQAWGRETTRTLTQQTHELPVAFSPKYKSDNLSFISRPGGEGDLGSAGDAKPPASRSARSSRSHGKAEFRAVSVDLKRNSDSDSVSERSVIESELATAVGSAPNPYRTFHSPDSSCSFTDADLYTVPPLSTSPRPQSVISSGLRLSRPPSALHRNSVRREWRFSTTCLVFRRQLNAN